MVTEAWLYGSTARGDRDRASDVDILIAGDDDVDVGALGLSELGELSVTQYTWEELRTMAGYGSLFLHHLRLEGRPLIESDGREMASLLCTLGPYTRAEQELDCFRQVVDDVDRALDRDHSVSFELSVVATAARHAAILGCYLIDEPDFGRDSAFRRLLPRLGYTGVDVEAAIELYKFRRADDEGRPPDVAASTDDARAWVAKVRKLIDQVRNLTHDDPG